MTRKYCIRDPDYHGREFREEHLWQCHGLVQVTASICLKCMMAILEHWTCPVTTQCACVYKHFFQKHDSFLWIHVFVYATFHHHNYKRTLSRFRLFYSNNHEPVDIIMVQQTLRSHLIKRLPFLYLLMVKIAAVCSVSV